MSSSSTKPSDGESLKRRYVFLVSPGENPSPALLELLQRRGERPGEWIQANHPLVALAHIACLERDRRLQARWYPDERFQNIFVVLNRDSWRDLESLFLTIQEHMRGVGIWVCTERLAIEIHPGEPGLGKEGFGGEDEPDDAGETSPPPSESSISEPSPIPDAIDPEASTGSTEPLEEPAADPSLESKDFSDDDELRVTEAELRDLLDLYDSNLPDPSDESDDPERKL